MGNSISSTYQIKDIQVPDFVAVATAGIQDVSALLPLLGTEQCEKLVTSALERGLFYAAATPMTIFGSLGIVKAGFVVFWSSIDTSYLRGPTLLSNAGFEPTGVGQLLMNVTKNDRQLYIAEDNLRSVLATKRIRKVTVNLGSTDLIFWNLKLLGFTIFFGGFGLLPYVLLIGSETRDKSFRTTWLYPVIRIMGCSLVSILTQVIFELRIIEETYCRSRFMATDSFFKDHGHSLPDYWDPNERSKNILIKLHKSLIWSIDHPEAAEKSKNKEPGPPPPFRIQCPENEIFKDLETISTFSAPAFGEYPRANTFISPPTFPQRDLGAAEQGTAGVADVLPPSRPKRFIRGRHRRYYISSLLFISELFLFFGLILGIVGYIGCFSLVQFGSGSLGPLVWLLCEVALSIIRILIWAWNPAWDDAKSPIALEKVDGPEHHDSETKNRYGIGWMLNAVTANDMHALIIGIDNFSNSGFPNLAGCEGDGKKIATYFYEKLLVPRNQIVTLYNGEATKDHIIQELKALEKRSTVGQDAPVVIYFATHSIVIGGKTYLVPSLPKRKRKRSAKLTPPDTVSDVRFPDVDIDELLPYTTIVDLLQHLANVKTDNITLILDSCNAGAMGRNKKFDKFRGNDGYQTPQSFHSVIVRTGLSVPPNEEANRALKKKKTILSKETQELLVGHSSHILLAGAAENEVAQERGLEGLFTKYLLEVLRQDVSTLAKMTYQGLVDSINKKLSESGQTALCTTIYQNKLLFNGLFARKLVDNRAKPVLTVQYSDD